MLDEKFCQSFIRNSILNGFVISSHDISDGGLAIALAECSILSAKGAEIELQYESTRDDNLLFAEGGSRIIFSIDKMKENEWLNYLERIYNLLFAEGGSRIIFSISKMKQNEWFNFLKQNQINFPSSVYVKKIGYVSSCLLYTSDAADE